MTADQIAEMWQAASLHPSRLEGAESLAARLRQVLTELDEDRWHVTWVAGEHCVTGEGVNTFPSEEEAHRFIADKTKEELGHLSWTLIKGRKIDERD